MLSRKSSSMHSYKERWGRVWRVPPSASIFHSRFSRGDEAKVGDLKQSFRRLQLNASHLLRGELFQQGFAFAEPGAFAALHVAGQRALFRQELLRPLARFVGAVRSL